jgi:hypothetical protein
MEHRGARNIEFIYVSAASKIEDIVSLLPPSRRDQKILDWTQYIGDARAQPERRRKILEIIWHIS